jgi:putative Flp pilus-assembly TadE/G-like protein
MSRVRDNERGQVIVLAAVMIPVMLLLTAVAVDVGNWYTHKRQLQNRADAGALAGGYQYVADWASCSGDAATKLAASNRIDAAARQYAGDPSVAGTLHNTEITSQSRVDVEVNSPGGPVNPDTSWNQPAGTGLGPCDKHPADPYSANDAYYVDVGVRERNQPSLFRRLGLELLRSDARARVELFSAAAGKGFLPIALPDQNIVQAQLRYYKECSSGPVLLATVPLNPLASTYQTPDTTFWGKTVGDLPPGVPGGGIPTGIQISMPEATACTGDDYIPISTEVRLAGVPSSVIDINAKTCAELVAAQFADCFSRVSNIRDFKDDPKTQPWIQEVTLQGGTCDAPPSDVLFARPDPPAASCTYGVSVSINFNGFATGHTGKDFTVSVGGDNLVAPNGPNGSPNGLWTSSGFSNNDVVGRSDISLSWSCKPNCGSGSYPIQSLFLGNATNAGVLSVVRTSETAPAPAGVLGAPLQSFRAGNVATLKTVYPTVGLDSSFYIGQKRVLRLPKCKTGNNDTNDCNLDSGSPNNSQSIDCEPGTGGQGHDFQMFMTGCDPFYTDNPLTLGTAWWKNPAPGKCPDKNGIIALAQPYECVVKAPGFSPGVIADGIAAAIGNCSKIQNNSCSKYACTNPNYYDPAQKTWTFPTTGDSPRIVYIFIVPYGSYKNTGSQETIPVLDFAAFYVTGFDPQGNGKQNPCTQGSPPPGARLDESVSSGGVVGYFVRTALPDVPGDPTKVCKIGQIRPCTPVLVR